jgi:Flp pilus assembly protein TadD
MKDLSSSLRRLPAVLLMAAVGLAVLSGTATADGEAAPARTAPTGLEPVFPPVNPNLVFVEAEDAVSTNFAREPVLNFGVSGFRALQLNRATGLEGVGSFYADYVFSLPSSGTWELWYGGTPPGPRDDLYPSYASPFTVSVDSAAPQAVTRESIWVVENYTPGFYWNRIGDLSMESGRHRIRFDVTEKRRADGRWLLYLDCFFLVKKENGQRVLSEPLPAMFPSDMENRSLDVPFPSLDDMLIRIRDNPAEVAPLVDISRLYSMLGDYLNALKYLNRAAALKPRDAAIGLLIAKNRIWKGDLPEGLKEYRQVLGLDPKQRAIWLEAGKVAAWNGSYPESIAFFMDALAAFPGDLDVTVNLGLTYLWAGRGNDAEGMFRAAQQLAGGSPRRLKDLARVYRVNGYPDRAAKALSDAVAADPRDLEARLLLIETQTAMGKKNEADAVRRGIGDAYVPSPRLASILGSFQEKAGLKEQVLAEDEARLAQNPDNLVLRQTLAQSYFWIGLKDKAVNEYRHIVANYEYAAISEMESRSSRLTRLLDRGFLFADWFSRAPALARQSRDALTADEGKLARAGAARDAARQALSAAQQAQSRAKEGKEADAALEAVHAAEDKLQSAEAARQKAGDDLADRAQAAAALLGRFEQVTTAAAEDAGETKVVAAQDAEAETVFAQVTRQNSWKFDRAGTLGELAQDTGDNDLARVIAAKIFLADRMAERAQAVLKPDGTSRAASSAAWTLSQSWLWGGKVKEAALLIARLDEDPGEVRVPSYFKDFAALAKSLSGPADISSEAPAAADPLAAAKAASAQLAAVEGKAAAQRAALSRTLDQLLVLYRHSLVRALYGSEQRVSSIRNELGDYYLAGEPPALEAAILQFKRVLAVDPGDLDATFRLGKVYEWNRDWSSALTSYRAVYGADPYFENVATLYNRLAREHAEAVTSLFSVFGDTQQTQWHAEAGWSRSLDSTLGISALYKGDEFRIQKTASGVTDHSAYQAHDVSVGLPINLAAANFSLAPRLGGVVSGNGLFQKTGSASANTDLFESYTVQPYARLDSSLGAWNLLFLSGALRWGPQAETLDPARGTVLYDASAEANLNSSLSTVDVPVVRDTLLRTYAKVDLVHTSALGYQNFMYTALQEVTVNVLKGGSPYSVLALTGSVIYQNSLFYEPYLYYAPDGIFVAGGSIAGSTWLGIGGGSVLGLSLRAFGGYYLELAFQPGTIHRFKGEVEANASVASGNGTWNLTFLGNGTWNFDAPSWDYWSMFVRLGYTLKLPDLLAP